MRDGKWTFEVLLDGAVQPEHVIEGRTVVESVPGKKFSLRAVYHGSEMNCIDVLVDGKSPAGRLAIDATGTTSHKHTSHTIEAWEKTRDGQKVKSSLIYAKTSTSDAASDEGDGGHGLASAPNDWTRGCFTLRVHAGERKLLQDDFHPSHDPDQSGQGSSMAEAAMVKGGHSATAAAAADKSFASAGKLRAGTYVVSELPGNPIEQEVKIFYRDSFFLMLKGDESKLLDDPAAQDASQNDAGLTDGEKKARVHARAHSELSKKLAKKPKVKGTSAAPIDLEDDENAGPIEVD